jgi:hypothetical protein
MESFQQGLSMPSELNVPSIITPGKVFKISSFKPQGRPAYVSAVEGTLEFTNGFEGFSYILHSARRHTVPLQGNNTQKNRDVALKQLLADLKEAGWIA